MDTKIKVDKTFLDALITKSWQDSEGIQSQIDRIDGSSVIGTEVINSLKNLLTNYYIFIGCLENAASDKSVYNSNSAPVQSNTQQNKVSSVKNDLNIPLSKKISEIDIENKKPIETIIEPFEYFVDFDEPTGEPLTDNDLYAN